MNMKIEIKLKFALIALALAFGEYISGQIDPAKKFGELFKDVQRAGVFQDQKSFVDIEPKISPDSILALYNVHKSIPGFNLKDFVKEYFFIATNDTAGMLRHIHYLWNDLTRKADIQRPYSSLLALPEPYIVPGGRFKEIYYWDSYFTMLGLQESGKTKLIRNMVDNFAFLINTYGHIPNGNRTYYLSRSQPPFFSLMVELLAETLGDNSIYTNYLEALEKEYQYWMNDNKAIQLNGNNMLNRYFDALNTPRPESYIQDENLFRETKRDSSLFLDIRSAAESGWDFSSRWFKDGKSMKSIITTQIIPIDLNTLLYHLEQTLAKAYKVKNNRERALYYSHLADRRKTLINEYCWNEDKGFYFDYNFVTEQQSEQYTLASTFPLFFNLSDRRQAEKVKTVIKKDFLKQGGLVTTLTETGEQWDSPNGWAPLQWVSYVGLKNYGYTSLANEIAFRWTNLNMKVHFETGKMMEKYNVIDINKPGGGGEYDAQDGFGWTNGVFLKMYNEQTKKPCK